MSEDKRESVGAVGANASVGAGLDLEEVLAREAGQLGRFQWRLLLLAALLAAAAGANAAEYIFTTARTGTRCLIPECEKANSTEFSPPWLANAVPPSEGVLDTCLRYAPRTPPESPAGTSPDTCPAALFDPTVTVDCEQFVYEDTNTVIQDLELACADWKRSLIGSVRVSGYLVSQPLAGWLSDRRGRRAALAATALCAALLGAARYWAASYAAFAVGQFVEAMLGGGTFTSVYILVQELVGPKYRAFAGVAIVSASALGHVLVAFVAWLVPYWRHFTLTIFLPQLLFVSCFWLAPESIRWYQSKGKFDKVEEAVKEIARVNGRSLSEKTLLQLRNLTEVQRETSENKKDKQPWVIVEVFRHKPILLRCLASPVLWITFTFVYYGLSINAVNMVGNKYLNYALVAAVEVPGFFAGMALMQRAGRRRTLAGGYWLCALCQLTYIFLPKDMFGVSLLVYLVGKSSISMVITTVYAYTAELYPTWCRHSLFAFSSMTGRVGAILAPLTPALGAAVIAWLPFALFGGMALLAGLLVLLLPETRGARLPDTMQQAARLGRRQTQ